MFLNLKQGKITLIEVPYRWDGTAESLAATIHTARSDLIANPPPNVEPIPSAVKSFVLADWNDKAIQQVSIRWYEK